MSSPWDGKAVNKQDADKAGLDVMIRYSKLMKVLPVKAVKL